MSYDKKCHNLHVFVDICVNGLKVNIDNKITRNHLLLLLILNILLLHLFNNAAKSFWPVIK